MRIYPKKGRKFGFISLNFIQNAKILIFKFSKTLRNQTKFRIYFIFLYQI